VRLRGECVERVEGPQPVGQVVVALSSVQLRVDGIGFAVPSGVAVLVVLGGHRLPPPAAGVQPVGRQTGRA
jgi:hypothetical protein